MNCRVCNTRLSPGERLCPNCGNDAGPGARLSKQTGPQKLPASDTHPPQTLPEEDDVELELDEVSGSGSSSPGSREPARPAAASPRPAPARRPAQAPTPIFSPDPAGLRALLADQPESLEAGLRVFEDGKGKKGAGYATPVGTIDLLARRGDDLVIVMVMEKEEADDLVAEVLKRVGWVRKHLANGARVRAVVLCQEAPEDLSYTAAAVSDTVSFKTYRVALTFEDVAI